ncbi:MULTISPECIES: DUF2326 domain-containing protein [unclassified Sinorhizobium]|uniref:DUF2326 domain-containing protein n=1 Tax=unclassified Sinorhizobium TaxID=2613772 RepID=UPI0035267C9E
MIIRIGSSIETFKTVELGEALNILLATRHETSDEKRTRNGSGKSSLVEIINFLHGSQVRKGSTFKAKELAKASFWADMVIDGIALRVERSVFSKDEVSVRFADGGVHGLQTEYDLLGGGRAAVTDWCDWLGKRMFRLQPGRNVRGEEIAPPKFRSLFSFFARRRQDGGFIRPQKSSEKQNDSDAQAALAWIFGLDWTLIREFDEQKVERNAISAIQKRAKGTGQDNLRTVAQLRSAVAVATAAADAARQSVANMRVVGHYEEMVAEASSLKGDLDALAREAAVLRSSIRHVEKSLEAEALPDGRAVESLYANAGKQLPDTVVKTFEQVRIFHESVVNNRRHHLGGELDRNRTRLGDVESEVAIKGNRREVLLRELQGAGAFSDLANLQSIQSQREAALLDLERRLRAAVQAEIDKSELKSSEASLLSRLQTDLSERTSAIGAAVLAVNEALKPLYSDRYGALEINAGPSGLQFHVHIEGDRSGGISNMEIFCFDYALLKIATLRLGGPGILIHDSHLFDGVDARQVATAIELGARLAEELGVQYLVLMNSDEYAKLQFSKDFDPTDAILDVRIDDTDEGGLFGFKFG